MLLWRELTAELTLRVKLLLGGKINIAGGDGARMQWGCFMYIFPWHVVQP